jgi:hypothetical protein
MERLVAIATVSPVDAVRAADLLAENPKERWFFDVAMDELQQILRVGLADSRSRESATRLVHRLVADGYRGFAALLEVPPSPAP